MNKICAHSSCTGCGLCCNACPTHAISLEADENGFLFPMVEDKKCIDCGKCYKICPSNNKIVRYEPKRMLVGWANDENVVMKSSSGGAFSSLANIVFQKGGVVAGVYYDRATGTLKHGIALSSKELELMRLSKYYQSKTENIYQKVKEYIDKQKVVLFTGTACQVAAMQSFIKEEERMYLITVDVLCHGVTNDKVVKAYLKSKERLSRSKIKDFVFRIKSGTKGWYGGVRMRLIFENDSIVDTDNQLDTYFVGFNNSLFLRESCYDCRYAGTSRISDFTFADYWGARYDSRFDAKRIYSGISLILVNTQKGAELVKELSHEMTLVDADKNIAIENNKSLTAPYPKNKNRELFFRQLNRGKDFDRIIKRIFRKYYILFYMRKALIVLIGKQNYARLKKILRG